MTLEWLVQTDGSVGALILRLTLAVVLFPHGAQKVLGWFGGPGLKATLQYFTSAGIPTVFGLLAIAAEFLGPLGLAVGLLTRVAAFGIVCVMLVAIITVHWRRPLACRDTSYGDFVCCSDLYATHARRCKGGICVDTITSCKTQLTKPCVTRTHVETTGQTRL